MSSRMIGTSRSQMLFWFALFVGATYFVAGRGGLEFGDRVAWKGLSVGLLALWAARHADTRDGWAIAAVLASGAAGDVLIETRGLVAGGAAFAVGHAIALWLYAQGRWRHGWLPILVSAFAVATVALAMTARAEIGVYAALLGAMAGAASLGRFPRTVAIGGWLFVASDLLLFARLGPLADSVVPDWTVWPTYFAGQALIAYGVVTAQAETPEEGWA